MSKKAKGINPELESAISKLMKEVMADSTATITDKMRGARPRSKARATQDEGC